RREETRGGSGVAEERQVLDLIDPAQAAKAILERERREDEVDPGAEFSFAEPVEHRGGRESALAMRSAQAVPLGAERLEQAARPACRREERHGREGAKHPRAGGWVEEHAMERVAAVVERRREIPCHDRVEVEVH